MLQRHTSDDFIWRGYHPFDQLTQTELADLFWTPLRHSISHLQRRQDIFFAGLNEIDDFKSTWVVSMGHLTGLFDNAWLGIPATGKMVFLRYCEFHRVEHGTIKAVSYTHLTLPTNREV